MTREGEVVVLGEHLVTCKRLEDRLIEIRRRLEKLMPITAIGLASLSQDDDIDILAFLKTYEQFEDTLGRTLKTVAMLMQFGKDERLQPRDVAFRAVALGIFEDGKAWADAVRVRNELAHEYPLNPDKQALQVNAAWEKSETLFSTAEAIRAFVEREGLMNGDI